MRVPFRVVIPARWASTRLPGKPLADIAGKPMVVRVAEVAAKSGAAEICIATDDERVMHAVVAHGFDAIMTHVDHASGTDRLAEAGVNLRLAQQHSASSHHPLDPSSGLETDHAAALRTRLDRMQQFC